MKVLLINSVSGIRSTGRICADIAEQIIKHGHECMIAYGRESVPVKYKDISIQIGSSCDVRLHALRTRIFDSTGFGSKRATKRFIEWVKDYNPDVIHLHNLHGYYINIEVLFKYLAVANKPVIWTLHDCWALTGHCVHFEFAVCHKWQTQCKQCPNKKEYPKSIFIDRSFINFREKKQLFSCVKDLTIVTPSNWLAKHVKNSFLCEYPVQVIHNGIDLKVFKPTTSDFRQRYRLEGKQIVLAVASVWDKRKGYSDILKLAKLLDDFQQLVIVGISEEQKRGLPSDIIGITRTNSVEELAQLYSAADVFVNPTYEDNYPTVNIEALACGIPVITYNTGGSPESIETIGYGAITEEKSPQAIARILNEGINNSLNSFPSIQEKVMEKFSIDRMVLEYLNLYDSVSKKKDCIIRNS